MEGPLMTTQSEFEVGATYIYSKEGLVDPKQTIDCFLSPFLYCYNNPEKSINVIVNDVPTLVQREFLARVLDKTELKDLLNQYIQSIAEGKDQFDPKILNPEAFIYPQVAYLTETLRQSCYVSKKIISIVDYNFVDLIEEDWEELGPKMRSLNTCLMPELPSTEELAYTDYIERHVLLDLFQQPFVRDNFVNLKSFPFHGKGTVGAEMARMNIFTIWNHFYNKHSKSINERKPSFDEIRTGGNKVNINIPTMEEMMRGKQEQAKRSRSRSRSNSESED